MTAAWARRRRSMHWPPAWPACSANPTGAGRRWPTSRPIGIGESDAQHRITRLFGSMAVFTTQGWQVDDVIGWRHDQIAFFPHRQRTRTAGSSCARCSTGRAPLRDFEFSIVAREPTLGALGRRQRTRPHRCTRPLHRLRRRGDATSPSASARWRSSRPASSDGRRWSAWPPTGTGESDEKHRLLPLTGEPHRRLAEFADRVEGRTLWDAFPKAMPAADWETLRADLDALRPFRSAELLIESDDGRRHWLSDQWRAAHRRDGPYARLSRCRAATSLHARKPSACCCVTTRNCSAPSASARGALQAINVDLDAFSRQLAHELRTPIGQVQGLAQLLQMRSGSRLADEDRELLDLQVQAATTMRDTVDALLHLARSTMQPMPTEMLDLSQLAHEVIDALPPLPRSAPLRWTVQTADPRAGLPRRAEDRAGQSAGQRRQVHAPCHRAGRAPERVDGRRRPRAHRRAGQRRGVRPRAGRPAVHAVRPPCTRATTTTAPASA